MHSTIRIPVGAAYGADEALPDMPQALTVADAIYHTVHGYPGGVVALAARMGVSANTLTHKANPNNATHHLTLKEAMALQQVSGSLYVLHVMAAGLDYICHRSRPDDAQGDPLEAFMRVQQSMGELTAAAADALRGGGDVSKNAKRRVEHFANEAMASIARLVSTVAARVPQRGEG